MRFEKNPCRRHNCDACCYDTRMSLTEDDVRRLERGGHRDFYDLHPDSTLRLKNLDGRCIFLIDGNCTAYRDRPDGCVLYPLIWYTVDDEAGLHDFCPHRHDFRFNDGDKQWLARSIATEDAEVKVRANESETSSIGDDGSSG